MFSTLSRVELPISLYKRQRLPPSSCWHSKKYLAEFHLITVWKVNALDGDKSPSWFLREAKIKSSSEELVLSLRQIAKLVLLVETEFSCRQGTIPAYNLKDSKYLNE